MRQREQARLLARPWRTQADQPQAVSQRLRDRTDTGRWTIPTGGLKKGETISQCAIRECREETGLAVEIIGLVGVFSTPDHVIAYGDGEVRQPVNICLRARVTGGRAAPTEEASEIRWVPATQISAYDIHPAILRRIRHGIESAAPHVDLPETIMPGFANRFAKPSP
jgi:8-oxo-dGTP pyrophosphatase MutT (NUDIX family)